MDDVKLTAQTFICLWCLTLRGVENHGILVISEVLSKQNSKEILWEDRVGGGRCGAGLGESPPVPPPTPGRAGKPALSPSAPHSLSGLGFHLCRDCRFLG